MRNDENCTIRNNPKKKFPYEVWLGGELMETFALEETAKDMVQLNEKMRELYCKNEYEKFVIKREDK